MLESFLAESPAPSPSKTASPSLTSQQRDTPSPARANAYYIFGRKNATPSAACSTPNWNRACFALAWIPKFRFWFSR